MVRTYWRASERGDWQAAGNCIGPGYRWIDHATGVDAQSPEELQEALADAKAWSNTRFQIEHAFEARDGELIVQASQSCNITGLWRSMETTGQHVSFPICTIFKFDSNDRIVHEETYYDMLSITRQLRPSRSTGLAVTPEQVVRAELDAWSRLDVDEISSWFADDAVWDNVPFGPVRGIAEIRKSVEGYVSRTTSQRIEILNLAVDGNVVLTERLDHLRFNEEQFDSRVMGAFEIRGDKIAAWRDYFDMSKGGH